MDRPCGKADCDTVIRDIGSHDGIGPHIDAIPYANVANQLGAGIKDDVIADAWVAIGLVIAPARAANCDLLYIVQLLPIRTPAPITIPTGCGSFRPGPIRAPD